MKKLLYISNLLVLIMLILSACNSGEREAEMALDHQLLTKNQVGAEHMPDSIAPVNAPFEMPEFKRPVFPDLTVNIESKGAKQNTISTKQIQAAIDEVTQAGGGTY